jgi:hypothetical protein
MHHVNAHEAISLVATQLGDTPEIATRTPSRDELQLRAIHAFGIQVPLPST